MVFRQVMRPHFTRMQIKLQSYDCCAPIFIVFERRFVENSFRTEQQREFS